MSSNTNQDNIAISDSWVDLSGQCTTHSGPQTPNRITPIPFGGEQDYLRMLREAQRESNRSSCKVSPISSAIMSLSSTTKNTPSASPKSPPNSPNPEFARFPEDLKGIYINQTSTTTGLQNNPNQPLTASELIWDWSSRPNLPSKEWRMSHGIGTVDSSSRSSSENGEAGKKKGSIYSKGVLYTLLLTNIVSLLLGAGLGIWFSKRGSNSGIINIGI